MLFPRILNSFNSSLNGIPQNYDPAIPADSVEQTLTPFEVQKGETLKIGFDSAFKGVLAIGPTATTVNVKVNGASFGGALASTNATVSGSDVTSSAVNASLHFGDNLKVLRNGDVIDISSFPASGAVSVFLFDQQNVTNILNSYGYEFKLVDRTTFTINTYNGSGAANLRLTQALTALTGTDKISLEIGQKTIVVKRNTTVIDTILLKYKATLENEAGTAAEPNAGLLKLAGDVAYTNTLLDEDVELTYEVGDIPGTYSIEFESELGRKILQKIVVKNDSSLGIGNILNALNLTNQAVSSNAGSPASWWNRNKTYVLLSVGFLGFALLGSWIINRLSK